MRLLVRIVQQDELHELIFQVSSVLKFEDTVLEPPHSVDPLLQGLCSASGYSGYARTVAGSEGAFSLLTLHGLPLSHPIPEEDRDTLKLPVVDAVVSVISKRHTVPVEGGAALKDPEKRKLESLLKQSFDVTALAVQVAMCGGLVARMCVCWAERVLDLESDNWELVEQEVAKIEMGASHLSDAMYNLLRASAKSKAFGVAARCTLWLRTWLADTVSKAKWTKFPFKGVCLVGEDLDKLVQTLTDYKVPRLPEDRPRLLPQGGAACGRDFRRFCPGRGPLPFSPLGYPEVGSSSTCSPFEGLAWGG
uniref:Uncharacterized protein LOC117369327 n=1 Tax=Geotrypetes seraphini TaxID=260995 RepID=A0A6P8SLB7_GEOSA|nr:uncharacterized protein LOC117369327 [Geotrypetes seraphini]